MEVVKELLEGGADPNQADEVRAIQSLMSRQCVTVFTFAEQQECTNVGQPIWTQQCSESTHSSWGYSQYSEQGQQNNLYQKVFFSSYLLIYSGGRLLS